MKKFSLILNSRGRPALLKDFLDSVVKTTSNLDDIEVIVGLDKDDPELIDSLNILNSCAFSSYWVGGRPPNLIGALNRLSTLAVAPYLYILNDDVIFLTPSWDSVAWSALAAHSIKFPHGVVYGRTQDLSIDKDKDGKYSAFPIISKKASEILGFCIPTEFYSLGGDVAIYRIFEKIGQIVDLSSIIIQHQLHQTLEQVMNPDLTAYEMRQNTYKNRMDWKTFNVDDYVWKLQNYINEYDKKRNKINE